VLIAFSSVLMRGDVPHAKNNAKRVPKKINGLFSNDWMSVLRPFKRFRRFFDGARLIASAVRRYCFP
jgi:hypothetical protein